MFSQTVQLGDTTITVAASDLREVIQDATALAEIQRDVALLQDLGARRVTLQHRRNGDGIDFYELVGTGGLKIGLGQHKKPDGRVPFFPGGYGKLFNAKVDTGNGAKNPEAFQTQVEELALQVYRTENRRAAYKARLEAFKTALDWPQEARRRLDSRIGDALRKRREEGR